MIPEAVINLMRASLQPLKIWWSTLYDFYFCGTCFPECIVIGGRKINYFAIHVMNMWFFKTDLLICLRVVFWICSDGGLQQLTWDLNLTSEDIRGEYVGERIWRSVRDQIENILAFLGCMGSVTGTQLGTCRESSCRLHVVDGCDFVPNRLTKASGLWALMCET